MDDATLSLLLALDDADGVDVEGVRQALAAGADANAVCDDPFEQLTVLQKAVGRESAEAVELLLAAGADPYAATADGIHLLDCCGTRNAALDALLRGGVRLDRLLALDEHGRLVDASGDVAGISWLHDAAESGDAILLDRLLSAGGQSLIDAFDDLGRTALGVACDRGNLAAARLLIERGADPDACNEEVIAFCPLDEVALLDAEQAAIVGVDLCRLLIDAGANPNQWTWMWITPYERLLERWRKAATGENPDRMGVWDRMLDIVEPASRRFPKPEYPDGKARPYPHPGARDGARW